MCPVHKCYGKLLPAIRLIIECNENGQYSISAVVRKTTCVLSTSLISYSLMEALINGSTYQWKQLSGFSNKPLHSL